MMAFIDQEASEKAEEIDAKVRTWKTFISFIFDQHMYAV